jgi:hypothetical protein
MHRIRHHAKIKCCQLPVLTHDHHMSVQVHETARCFPQDRVLPPGYVAGQEHQEWAGAADGSISHEGWDKRAVVNVQQVVHSWAGLVRCQGRQLPAAAAVAVAAAGAVAAAAADKL